MIRRVLRNFLFVVIISSFGLSAFASNDIDSLTQLLDKVSEKQKSSLLNQLSLEYLNVSPQTSLNFAYRSLLLAQKFNNYPDLANALKTLASINYQYGSIDTAVHYTQMALKIFEQLNDSEGISKVLNNLGIFYNGLGNFEKAITYHLESLRIKQNMKDSAGIAYSSNNIGALYYQLAEYQTALKYFEKALRISQSIGDKESEQSSLSNIGLIYYNLKLYDKAIEVFLKSNRINNLLNNIQNVSNNLALIANIYFEKGMLDDALEYYMRSENLNESYDIKEPQTLFSIAVLFDSLKEYENSLKYYRRACKMAELANEHDILLKASKGISEVFSETGNWQKAYKSLKRYTDLDDSLSNDETNISNEDKVKLQIPQATSPQASINNEDTIEPAAPIIDEGLSISPFNNVLIGIAVLLFIALVILAIKCFNK